MSRIIPGATPIWIVSAGVISLIGVVLFVPNVLRLTAGSGPTPALVLAAVGAFLSTVLIVIGYLLFRDETTRRHVPRIAGWATLGTVLLGSILFLISLSGIELPLFAGATLLSVSTFAHVLIGVRDVQRIRAEELGRQREKLAVLNRLVRHDLRHEAQYLVGIKSEIPGAGDADERYEIAGRVEAISEQLSEMHNTLKRTQEIIRSGDRETIAIDLEDAVEDVVSEYREDGTDATISVDVPEGYRVRAGPELRMAIGELIENALVYADGEADVRVTAERSGGHVRLAIADNGPGIPEPDRSVIARETEIGQLTHAQGIGLWFVRWAMDAYDGGFDLETGGDGTTVTLEFATA